MDQDKQPAADASLPVRAQDILRRQWQVCQRWIQPLLLEAVADAENALFEQAKLSRNNTEQEAGLASVSKLHQHGLQLPARFLDRLAQRLQHFAQPPEDTTPEPKQVGLALLADQSQDEGLFLDDLAARAQARATMPLFELGHRYAVLGGLPVLETAQQPFAPPALCACIRHALADAGLPEEHALEVYRAFDRKVLQRVATLYGSLNNQLIDDGILPHLKAFATRRRGAGRRTRGPEQADSDDHDWSRESTTDDAQPVDPAPDLAGPDTDAKAEDDRATVALLTNLLDQRRKQQAPTAPTGHRRQAEPADIHQVLGQLQKQASTVIDRDGRARPRSMQELRRGMLAQLRQLDPTGAAPHFGPQQLDVLELTTMLFDRLAQDIQSTPGTYLLSELQAPLLRVAMEDQHFFTHHDHPARNWLEKVAEASARWGSDVDKGDGDPALIKRIHAMNRTINRDFDGDLTLFEGMASDLDKQLQQVERRAEVAERRQVEASRGRERLTLARARAGELVDGHVDVERLSSLTRAVLRHAWTDVLALDLLRHGEDSDEFRHKLHIADVLGGAEVPEPGEHTDRLRNDLEQGLIQVGMEAHEADLLAREVTGTASDDPDAPEEDQLTRTQLALKLKQRTPIGTEQIDQITEVPDSADEKAYQDAVAHIKSLAFGTWFEFDDPEFDSPVQRKMAWFSTRTGRCLFVNRRGMRTHDTTIDHLAQAMVAGTARLTPTEKGSFISRALNSILANLKKVTAGAKAEAGQTA